MVKPTTQHKGSGLSDPLSPTLITAAERNMKASKVILYATSALLVLIWMSAFIISYVSLVAVATVGGLTYTWVWLWPLLLDAFMCIGSLDVIRRELNGETTTIAWAVVIGVTLVSTGFNITLSDPNVLSWATHALAPVVCFLAFEIEMGVLRSYFRQHDNITKMSETGRNVKPIVNVPRENVRYQGDKTRYSEQDSKLLYPAPGRRLCGSREGIGNFSPGVVRTSVLRDVTTGSGRVMISLKNICWVHWPPGTLH